MSQSRRIDNHPPVLTTEDHAAVEAAFFAAAKAGSADRIDEATDDCAVPDSPAELWTSVSRSRVSVGPAAEQLPAELTGLVAPPIKVRLISG